MLDSRDPHYALGVEHALRKLVPVTCWQDPEHTRRYLAGYQSVSEHLLDYMLRERQQASVRLNRSVLEQLQRLAGKFDAH